MFIYRNTFIYYQNSAYFKGAIIIELVSHRRIHTSSSISKRQSERCDRCVNRLLSATHHPALSSIASTIT